MKRLLSALKSLFRPKPKPVLPHPEEPINPNATVANTDVDVVFATWFTGWKVPVGWRDYWRNAIVVELRDRWDGYLGLAEGTPAATWDGGDGKRHLASLAPWFNAGVLSHEQAHNSYALLTPEQKDAFETLAPMLKTDPLVAFMLKEKPYGLTSTVELHAEVFRFLGGAMPKEFKRFYPRLFADV